MMGDIYNIADVISRDPGFVVSIRDLHVSKTKNGKYRVAKGDTEELYDNKYKAAEVFVRKRQEYGFGMDLPGSK